MHELLHSTRLSTPTLLTTAVGQSNPSRAVQTCVAKNAAQGQTKYGGSNPGSAVPELTSGRTVLDSVGEKLALAICLSGWAKPTVCEACLGTMSNPSPTA